MCQQAVKQAYGKNSMNGAPAALGKSIARLTDKDGLLVTAISALSLSRRDADPANELHVRAKHLRDRLRGQTRTGVLAIRPHWRLPRAVASGVPPGSEKLSTFAGDLTP